MIRPARVPPRPLSGLAELLGVGRTDFIPNGPGRLAGVTLDSRQVQAGDLYAALPGEHTHGAAYCDQAVAAGAIAILTDQAGRDRAARTGVPVFVVSAPRDRLNICRGTLGNLAMFTAIGNALSRVNANNLRPQCVILGRG